MIPGRTFLQALAVSVFFWVAFGVMSDGAMAQCGNCRPPPTCNTCQPVPPPSNCCRPAPPPPNNQTCCSPNHNVYVPGVNVYVAPSVVVNANVNASINLTAVNYNNNYNNNLNNNNNNNNGGGGTPGTPGTGNNDNSNSNTNIINNVITATSSSVSNASSVSNSTATGGAGGIGIGIGSGTGSGGGTGGGGSNVTVNAYGGNGYGGGGGLGGAGGSATAYAYGSAFSDSLGIGMGGSGGGGQMFFTPPMATGYIQGLTVEGPSRVQKVAYEATRKMTRRVIIQAFCLDDKDVPHPASQLTPDRDVGDYEGEIYRCLAGTRLQYVVAEYKAESAACLIPAGDTGRAAASCFNGGQTIVCNKSDSLYYTPNGTGGGALACKPQKPARDCNERSLLRRFGAGVKILTIVSMERYTDYREEVVREASTVVQTNLALDGGVGGVAF